MKKQMKRTSVSNKTNGNALFPLEYNGKLYERKDCSKTFLNYYHTSIALNDNNGVYAIEGLWIYPDGTTKNN